MKSDEQYTNSTYTGAEMATESTAVGRHDLVYSMAL